MRTHRPALLIATTLLILAHGVAEAQTTRGPQVTTLRIYLARHGETDGNATGRAQGWTDTPLNATGREQAARLAEAMKSVQLDAIYSSTLSRSRETAETAAAGRPVMSLPGLREMNLGRFEDRPIGDPELRKRNPAVNPEDGESGPQFYERVSGTIREILARHPEGGTILIVGHAGANQQVMRTLLELEPGQARINQANDEVFMIELDSNGTRRVFKLFPPDKLNEL